MPRTRRGRGRGIDSNKGLSGPDQDGNPGLSESEVLDLQQHAPTMNKLQDDFKLLKEENRLLKEENRLLKEERDFLRKKIDTLEKAGPTKSSKVHNPQDVVHRYRAVLKEFRRTRSMSLSCNRMNVDRNTIALTAVIAEVMIAAEGENFGPLPTFTDDSTINSFAKTCKAFLEENRPLEEKIKKMKKDSELLPIKCKFRK